MVIRAQGRLFRRHAGGRAGARDVTAAVSPRRNAPIWTGPAATAALAALEEEVQAGGLRPGQALMAVLRDRGGSERLIGRLRGGTPVACRHLAQSVLQHHRARLAALGPFGPRPIPAAQRLVDRALAQMRARATPLAMHMAELTLRAATRRDGATFEELLSKEPSRDRAHSMAGRHRVLAALRRWDFEWLTGVGVICFERHAGRVEAERPGCNGAPTATFLRGVVRRAVLPTAVSNRADHYILVDASGPVRLLSVQENARAMGVHAGSSLMGPLLQTTPTLLTALQAVEALGNGVHALVMGAIVRELVDAGRLGRGATYGTAFSGVDVAAVGVEAALEGEFKYVFASEKSGRLRAVLAAAWGGRGLTAACCYEDARDERALSAPSVDLWVATPSCKENSGSNRMATDAGRAEAAADFDRSLDYVRRQGPKVVVVENVTASSVVLPITCMLASIPGYEWATGVLDPHVDLGEPVDRTRQFWVGLKLE